MKTRNVVGGLMGVLVLLAAGACALTWRSEIDEVARPSPDATDPGLIEQGDRLAAAGISIACPCPAVRGGEAFAGGPAVPTDFGDMYFGNITPDEETRIS
ncbi:hypothetical protein EF888_15540 [Silicimonas algicola]|uniref:Uncharacterized protein n=1 Tax=Silicimonas algicola TaxID=1826607 RepID=A0A316G0K5_9RHOB|nr:hypothetical protein [Silicimonas algicola]AZQ68417.1 hypothetical protein EF888_15540 [Silicimonas algicola]PWK53496.1 hypothetical protein C8D95_11321 [Silicimonas algicola]